jgi:sirohydrochlorin ferrochelatase
MVRSKVSGVKAEMMRKIAHPSTASSILLMLILLLAFLSIPICIAEEENEGNIGVLVIASSSPNEDWCKPVQAAVENVSLPYPVELGFLDFVPNETITVAVERFDAMGITKILAVPLSISSYSDHIRKVEYVLGLRDNLLEGAENLTQVDTNATIMLLKAMDDHPLVAYTLADRVIELSKDPSNETVVIVAYGSDDEDDFSAWSNNLDALAEETRKILRWWVEPSIKVKDVKYAFIHLNETLHPDRTVRAVVENEPIENDVIVVPLMISEGLFTDKYIPQLLENLTYAYNGKALTPHPNVAAWIETRVICARGDESYGVLVIDHGSKGLERVNVVRELMKEVNLGVPVALALAFAEHPPENESIMAGIDKLLRQGVNHIIAITLFTQPTIDHDEAVEEVYAALETAEQTEILQNTPKHMGIRITVAGPIDDNPLIAELILDRAREVSEDENNEILVICRWGDSTYIQHSELYAQSLADQVKAISDFKDVKFGFMGISSPNIRQAVAEVAQDGSVIVVTTNSLGSSYVDGLIAKKLKDLNYTYNGKGFYGYPKELSPHQNIARWIESTAFKADEKTYINQGIFVISLMMPIVRLPEGTDLRHLFPAFSFL